MKTNPITLSQIQSQSHQGNALTAEQCAVVEHDLERHAKVVAVAGAGKTTTLIARIERLLAQGVPAHQLGVFMFNKSAQTEFSQRLQTHLVASGHARLPDVMTFHGFGLKLCRRMEQAGLLESSQLVTDEFSLVKLIREAMQQLVRRGEKIILVDEKEWLEDVLLFIDQVKAAAKPAKVVFDDGDWSKDRQFFPLLYDVLEKIRRQRGLRFFADLLADPLLKIDAESLSDHLIHANTVPNYRYLLIDEFQDINPCQYRLLKALYPAPCQWMIVGDVQQCIYEWRGASPDIMAKQFDEDFTCGDKTVTTYPLSSSFRFGHQIGLMASSVIAHNNSQTLVIGAGSATDFSFAQSDKSGKALLSELKNWLSLGGALDDAAVLVRLYSDMVPIQLALMHKGIPYHLHGDSPLLENRQIRMLLAYLAVMAEGLDNPTRFHQKQDIEVLLTVPSLGLAPNRRKAFVQQCQMSPHLLPQLMDTLADEVDGWRAKKHSQRADWLRSLPMYRNNPAQGLLHTIEKLGIYRYFDSTSSKEIQANEKIATCEAFIAYVKGVGGTADEVLDQLLALAAKPTEAEHTQGVHLMTIHKAKGLEFGQVMLAGLQEGRFPYYEDEAKPIDVAAERRLFYVGITRAKRRLVILHQPTKVESDHLKKGTLLASTTKSSSLSRFVYESLPLPTQDLLHHWSCVDAPAPVPLMSHQVEVFKRYLAACPDSPSIVFPAIAPVTASLCAGDKVRHDQFGTGVVLRQDKTGKQMIFVEFEELGLKKFNPRHTKLIKVSALKEAGEKADKVN